LQPGVAVAAAVILILVSLAAGFLLSPTFAAILLTYLIIQVAYSFYLKNILLLDVLIVAAGFILRVAAGVAVIQVERFSPWLYVCTGLLAVFLVLVAYSLYTFLAEGLPGNHLMMLTIPFVLYAIFRYLYLIHVRHEGGAPEEIFLRDRPMQATLLLWAGMVFFALYVVA
jgi:4-hydroxybenzoate polyprenyltransferase